MSTQYGALFAIVQNSRKENRWGAFVTSYVVQAIASATLVFYVVTSPTIIPMQTEHVQLVSPELNSATSAPKSPKLTHTKIASEQLALTVPVTEKISVPVLQAQQPQRVHRNQVAEIPQPQLSVPAPKFDSKVFNALPGPKAASRIVATNTFGGSSATPTLQKAAPSKVQTGGFGDPNSVVLSAQSGKRPNLAASGAFDLPAGGANGNGKGGSSGIRGTVASAGFGNSTAVQGSAGHGSSAGRGNIQTTGFATASAVPPDDARHSKAANHPILSAPVSIQSKPTPVYTSEARQLKVEGEVLLNVVFTAEGQVRVLKVMRGLGHGLDESAQRAAQGLRFSPALRDGHPVDSTATLHIVFQLS